MSVSGRLRQKQAAIILVTGSGREDGTAAALPRVRRLSPGCTGLGVNHRLVYIHPFSKGNGRWGRLMTDVLAVRDLGLSSLTWAVGNDDFRDPDSAERKKYIAAIKAADAGNIDHLVDYLINITGVCRPAAPGSV